MSEGEHEPALPDAPVSVIVHRVPPLRTVTVPVAVPNVNPGVTVAVIDVVLSPP